MRWVLGHIFQRFSIFLWQFLCNKIVAVIRELKNQVVGNVGIYVHGVPLLFVHVISRANAFKACTEVDRLLSVAF